MNNANDYLREPYARIVIPTENGGFHAEILEFPGCYAQGETAEEAYSNLERTAEAWIRAGMNQGQEIPRPSSSVGFSGKVSLRLPKSIHRQAARMAERDGASLNQFLVSAVAARVGAQDLYGVMVRRLEQRAVAMATKITVHIFSQVASTAQPVVLPALPGSLEKVEGTAPEAVQLNG